MPFSLECFLFMKHYAYLCMQKRKCMAQNIYSDLS